MKERLINTRFWNDNWVRKLNPLDRYLLLYILTNEYTNISGIYELPISTMAYGSGIDERDLEKTMIPRLEPKVYYKDGWIIITNFLKFQRMKSESIREGVKKSLNEAPKSIIKFAKSIGYGDGLGVIPTSSHILEPEPEPESEPESEPEFEKPLPIGKGEQSSHGNPLINKFLSYLAEKTEIIDTPQKYQRRDSWTLIRKMTKLAKEKKGGEPTDEEVWNGLKFIVDTACEDKFHSQRAGNIRYLYGNIGAIVKARKNKGKEVII